LRREELFGLSTYDQCFYRERCIFSKTLTITQYARLIHT